MIKIDLDDLKARCPLPVLLRELGLGHCAKRSCRSPLRQDHNASWGIYPSNGRYYWKDFGTGEGGDEVEFLARYLKGGKKMRFHELLEKYEKIARKVRAIFELDLQAEEQAGPDRTGFGLGTPPELERLSNGRGFSVESLKYAQEKGWLVFGNWYGLEVFGLTDCSGNALELRRLDGKMFPAVGNLGERKCHAVKGSRKDWPIGALDVTEKPAVALVEGIPDFLAAVDIILQEGKQNRVAPVTMLSASSSLSKDALVHFKKKQVRIFSHADQAGVDAARRWKNQLIGAGAKKVEFYDLRGENATGTKVKDLCDFMCNALVKVESQPTSEVMP